MVDSRGQAVLLRTQVGAFGGDRVDRRVERREPGRCTRRGREVERVNAESGGLKVGDRDVHDLTGIQTRLDVEARGNAAVEQRSEEHTSELQSLMRISYAVFCL